MQLVTQNGMTKSQPGICVAYTSPVYDNNHNIIGGAQLSAIRNYPQLPNEWGGKGRHKELDGHGRIFETVEQARQYALEHGYVRAWFRPYDPGRKQRQREFFKTYVAPKLGITIL